jgi:hypothetical protein
VTTTTLSSKENTFITPIYHVLGPAHARAEHPLQPVRAGDQSLIKVMIASQRDPMHPAQTFEVRKYRSLGFGE